MLQIKREKPMKIIEGLKKIKDLQRKAQDLRHKVASCSAKMSYETDKYEDQKFKVAGWLQSHHDIVLEIERLRECIARTNLETQVTIEFQGKEVTKSIHNWISRRRDLSQLDYQAWASLSDRGLMDQRVKNASGDIMEVKVVRFYDPEEKDKKLEEYKSEEHLIDSKLEVINAITDLKE